jgi:DNA processing protein
VDTIGGFWIGAINVADQLDLEALAARFGGWGRLARATPQGLVEAGVPELQARLWLASPAFTTQGHALTRCCADYPLALAAIARPPPVVFVEGDLDCFRTGAVAIVGTRRCSPIGAAAAHELGLACARAGLVVVSGLARGIDRHAHQGALRGGGRTVAVLAHGLQHTAPPSNVRLREDIVRSGGALLTTWPDPVPPARWTFPIRNRWIAALSRRVVIVEAPERSGALLTATHLAELGRDEDLRVVPGPFGAETWRGSAELLTMGARPLCDADSLLREFGLSGGNRPPASWLAALLSGATVDEAAEVKGVPTTELIREIGELEVSGRLVRLPGGRYAAGGGLP